VLLYYSMYTKTQQHNTIILKYILSEEDMNKTQNHQTQSSNNWVFKEKLATGHNHSRKIISDRYQILSNHLTTKKTTGVINHHSSSEPTHQAKKNWILRELAINFRPQKLENKNHGKSRHTRWKQAEPCGASTSLWRKEMWITSALQGVLQVPKDQFKKYWRRCSSVQLQHPGGLPWDRRVLGPGCRDQ